MTGLRDLLDGSSILLVEWPARGLGRMPPPDFQVDIRYHGSGRRVRVRSSGAVELPRPC